MRPVRNAFFDDFIDSLAGSHRLRLVPLRFFDEFNVFNGLNALFDDFIDSLASSYHLRLVPLRFLMNLMSLMV